MNAAPLTRRSSVPANAQTAKAFDIAAALLNSFAINDRINHYLVRNLAAEVWKMEPPAGKGRTIAAIFAHMHNVRRMWLKAVGYQGAMPDKLERDCSQEQAIAALETSDAALSTVITAALAGDGRIKGFKPDVAGFLGYLFSHDAHHRGQASMLARQLGFPLSKSATFGMWEWGVR
jgi:uncharacterized damage-inducible protein DinB